MGFLYLMSEDDNDDLFYKACVEKLIGFKLELVMERLRKGGGISAVQKMLPIMLQNIQYTGVMENTYFVISLDNDRSFPHPHHNSPFDPGKISKLPKREQNKPCRFCSLQRIINQHLRPNKWPIDGAIAVPVQMLESWLLLVSNPKVYKEESALPLFSGKAATLAKRYFAPHPPPDQLKDLREKEKARLGIRANRDYCAYCAEHLDPNALAGISPSFALFKDQVELWSL